MSDIERWSPTPEAGTDPGTIDGNSASPPDGFPEGMTRSSVNNSNREIMSAIKRWWDDPEWRDVASLFVVAVDGPDPANAVRIQGTNDTTPYSADRKVRIRNSAADPIVYAFIDSAVVSGPDVIVTVSRFDLPETKVYQTTNGIDVYIAGGAGGIRDVAFETGSGLFELPTSFDSAGIQAAIDLALAGDKNVFIPSGTYSIDAALTVTGTVEIIGAGAGRAILEVDADVTCFVVSASVSSVKISSIEIDGKAASRTGTLNAVTFAGSNVNCSVDECYIHDVQSQGVAFVGTANIYNSVRDCLIQRTGQHGVRVQSNSGDSTQNSVSDCVIIDPGHPDGEGVATSSGIEFSGSGTISGCAFVLNSTGFSGEAIQLVGGADPLGANNVEVSGILVSGLAAGANGVFVQGRNITLSGVIVNLAGASATALNINGAGADPQRSVLVGVYSSQFLGGSGSLIGVNTSRINCSGCTFGGSSAVGLQSSGDDIRVLASVIDTVSGGSGISLAAQSSSNIISGCTIASITGDGVSIASGASNNQVTACTFLSVSGSDIVDAGTHTTAAGNNPRDDSSQSLKTDGTQLVPSGTSPEVAITDLEQIALPGLGANGFRKFRVSLQIAYSAAGNGSDVRFRVRVGSNADPLNDAEIYTWSIATTGNTTGDVQSTSLAGFEFVPAIGEVVTLTGVGVLSGNMNILGSVPNVCFMNLEQVSS